MNRRLVVIGGNGFIGQETMRQALRDGWEVLNLDPAGPRGGSESPVTQHHAVSVTDAAALTAAIRDFTPDAAINLAAYGDGTQGLASGATQAPARAVDINIGGMVNLIDALAEAGTAHLIWSSSSTVYGPAAGGPAEAVTETAALHPDIVYGATKVGAEEITRVLAPLRGIRAVAVRLPLIYGSGRWYGGSQDSLVRFVGDLVAGGSAHLEGWTDPADWMHVSDAAGCLLALAGAPDADAPAYNVTGHRCSLLEMGQALIDAAAAADRATVIPTSEGAPTVPLMDTGLIESHLGYRPVVTSAGHGAQLYIDAATDSLHTEETT